MSGNEWPYDPALKEWGATFNPAIVAPGQTYWKLIMAQGPQDMGGNHHVYVDVWDEQGNRVVGVRVECYWADDHSVSLTEAKTGEPAAVNFPMYASGNAYGVRVADALPSDSLYGMGLASFGPHQSFLLVFQRTVAGSVQLPEPPTGMDMREALRQAKHYIDLAERLLDDGQA